MAFQRSSALMFRVALLAVALPLSSALTLTTKDLNLNFKATFTDEIQTFNIAVDKEFLATTKLKASMTRFVDELEDQPEFTDGPPKHEVHKVARYWAKEYDWRKIESEINSQFHQFTTIVQTNSSSNHTDPIPLHFVHHKSPRADAIPLLFVHGWPGSFLEVDNIIGPLTNPPNDSHPAFHVVAPSIPGYGFSPSPRKPGMGYRQAGATFHALMQKLGYSKYVFQGGDAGDVINRYMAVDFPDAVVSGHSNFWISPPSPSDLSRYAAGEASEDEKYVINMGHLFVSEHWSYGQLHQTRPLKLAVGLTDSPVGLAMWIYDLCRGVVKDPSIWTPERIITWTMMHWINGPYGALSLYKNGRKDGAISIMGISSLPYVSQPIAISEFPLDIWYRTPLEWAQRGGNVKYRTMHKEGGHFAALDVPHLLLNDIWHFFGDEELSGTKVFRTQKKDSSAKDEL